MKVSKSTISELGLPRGGSSWERLAKLVTARFARGNTAAQFASILFPREQDAQRAEAELVASAWEKEFRKIKGR